MSRARSSSSPAIAGSGVSLPPFAPPLTTAAVFFSAIPVTSLLPKVLLKPNTTLSAFCLVHAGSKSEDRQIKRNQYPPDNYSHHDENHRFNQGHGRAQGGLYILFVKFRHRTQHCWQSSGGFTNLEHLHGQVGKDFLG